MLASVEKRFVLLSNPKTGTTARGGLRAVRRHPDRRLAEVEAHQLRPDDRIFGDYFQRQGCTIYAVVRHPVDALASWYRYRSRPDLASRAQWHDKYTGDISFAQFVEEWAAASTRGRGAGLDEMVPDGRAGPGADRLLPLRGPAAAARALSRHVGRKVKAEKLNVSPERAVDVDRAAVAALAQDAKFIAIYDSIPLSTAGLSRARSCPGWFWPSA